VLLWNLVPTHPHEPGNPESNRRPTRQEVEVGRAFLRRLAGGRRIVPIGRLAHAELGGSYIRHPSHGGTREFRAALVQLLA
jgi:uracil-DNA glycosylase